MCTEQLHHEVRGSANSSFQETLSRASCFVGNVGDMLVKFQIRVNVHAQMRMGKYHRDFCLIKEVQRWWGNARIKIASETAQQQFCPG